MAKRGADNDGTDDGMKRPRVDSESDVSEVPRMMARTSLSEFVRETAVSTISSFLQDIVNGVSGVRGLRLADVCEHDIKSAISTAIESAISMVEIPDGDIGKTMAMVCDAALKSLGGAAAFAREKEREEMLKHFNTHMQRACKDGDTGAVSMLLNLGASRPNDVTMREYAGWFSTARLNGRDAILTLLFDSLKPSKFDSLALRLAAKFGYSDIVRELLQYPCVEPHAVENAAIILACEYDHLEVVMYLLNDPRVDPTARNDCPLRWGAQHGNIEIVNAILQDHRVNPAACNNFPVRQASIRGHHEVVAKLLSYTTVDPSTHDNRAIRLACIKGHDKVVKLLLDDGRVDPCSRDNVAIRHACKNGHAKVVEHLLACNRIDPNLAEDAPLTIAAKHGHVNVVKTLLRDRRVNPAIHGNAALLQALSCGHLDVARVLVTRIEVLASARTSLPADKFAEFTRIHSEMVAASEPIARRALAWHRAMQIAAGTEEREISQRPDLVGKILGLAFGRELIVSRENGDGTTIDIHTQVRAERLLCKLVNTL